MSQINFTCRLFVVLVLFFLLALSSGCAPRLHDNCLARVGDPQFCYEAVERHQERLNRSYEEQSRRLHEQDMQRER